MFGGQWAQEVKRGSLSPCNLKDPLIFTEVIAMHRSEEWAG